MRVVSGRLVEAAAGQDSRAKDVHQFADQQCGNRRRTPGAGIAGQRVEGVAHGVPVALTERNGARGEREAVGSARNRGDETRRSGYRDRDNTGRRV